MSSKECKDVKGLLPASANGTLDPRERPRVRDHLRTCASCREELASWHRVAGAVRAEAVRRPEPSVSVPESVLARIEAEKLGPVAGEVGGLASRLSLAGQMLRAQAFLIGHRIWIASALTMALGFLVALSVREPASGGTVLALFAPVVAAVGVAFVYGPENDPSLEIALSTPTRPRHVLLARLVLVYAYDLALVLGATALLAAVKGEPGLWTLVTLWVGPMLFLSALALLLALLFGSATAVLVAMGLWATRLAAAAYEAQGAGSHPAVGIVEAFWQANPILLPAAAALLSFALLCVGRQERLA